jgi:hypothetical protein
MLLTRRDQRSPNHVRKLRVHDDSVIVRLHQLGITSYSSQLPAVFLAQLLV